ncbi:MAG: hypothetical protein GF334_10760 [Candidatus Altiarchaeales archaeon]|nr:hypothetical protein [Candidatus Altiarchaeales archaeon]
MVVEKRRDCGLPYEKQLVLPLKFNVESTGRGEDGLKQADAFRLPDETQGRVSKVLVHATSRRRLKLVDSLAGKFSGADFYVMHTPQQKEAVEKLKEKYGGRVRLVEVDLVSGWAQDSVFALENPAYGLTALMAAVKGKDGLHAASGFMRRAEQKTPKIFAEKMPGIFGQLNRRERGLRLRYFEGGDIQADESNVFVGEETLRVNIVRKMISLKREKEALFYRGFRGYESFWSDRIMDNQQEVVEKVAEKTQLPIELVKMEGEYNSRGELEFYWEGEKVAESERYTHKFIATPFLVKPPSQQEKQQHLEQMDPGRREEISRMEKQVRDFESYLEDGVSSKTVEGIKRGVRKKIEKISGNKRVVFVGLPKAPYFHLDMYMKPLGGGKIVLASNKAGLESLTYRDKEGAASSILDEMDRFMPDARLNEVGGELEGKGFEVVRMPALMPCSRTAACTHATYCNVELEQYEEGGRLVKKVYSPTYGITSLDAEAKRRWEQLGYEFQDVGDLSDISKNKGSLRCCLKVLERK